MSGVLHDAEIPIMWYSCRLGDVVDYGKTEKAEPDEIADESWVLELEDIEKDTSRLLARVTFAERKSKSTKNRFETGDILYGKLRPYLNKVLIADQPGVCTTEIIPLRKASHIDNRYLFYWLKHPTFLDYVTAVSHGLNMPRLGTEAGKAAPFILAPLAEQKRIADKLESLLGRVDACRARLDRLPALLKRFRQSVLAAATSGHLTEEWRMTNGVNDEWGTPTLNEVTSKITDGEHITPKRASTGKYLLSARNIQNGTIALSNVDYVPISEYGRIRKRCDPSIGDVLLSCSGSVGRAAKVDRDDFYVMVRSAAMIRPIPSVLNSTFLMFGLQSPFMQEQILEKSSATAQSNIFIGSIKSLYIPLPTLPEQQEIVRRVEALFAFADRIESRLATAQKTVERLTPATLAKAFRGELVPQDPTDEPASALLGRLPGQPGSKPAKLKRTKHATRQKS